ncbi:MAG TPA: MmcQ/YjbR family DNA-binding protein [Steroidobacteraceae bacterium]|jgi:hypothetical protein|nr:MmcQ/YjbR family DNA-binding protein [Steroidobacteraceae bacterium]
MSGVTFQDVAAVACALPEVEISKSYGTPSLKVRGKMMARMKEDGKTLVLRTDFVSRQILTQADPEAFYITDHYRDYPLLLVRLSAVRRDALPDLLERAWRELAPKTLVAGLDARQAKSNNE